MKETDQELVSRILDEGISEFETRRILKKIQQDPELYSTYQRYNLIGYAMRKQLPARLNPDFSKEVMDRLSPGAGPDTDHPPYRPANMKVPVAMGIAAVLALFSFVMLQDFIPLTPSSGVVPVEIAERASEDDVQDFVSSPKAAEDFNSYIVNHAEYASPRVSMPRVRIVSYNRPYSGNGDQ